jgi:hypothetical protein
MPALGCAFLKSALAPNSVADIASSGEYTVVAHPGGVAGVGSATGNLAKKAHYSSTTGAGAGC